MSLRQHKNQNVSQPKLWLTGERVHAVGNRTDCKQKVLFNESGFLNECGVSRIDAVNGLLAFCDLYMLWLTGGLWDKVRGGHSLLGMPCVKMKHMKCMLVSKVKGHPRFCLSHSSRPSRSWQISI